MAVEGAREGAERGGEREALAEARPDGGAEVAERTGLEPLREQAHGLAGGEPAADEVVERLEEGELEGGSHPGIGGLARGRGGALLAERGRPQAARREVAQGLGPPGGLDHAALGRPAGSDGRVGVGRHGQSAAATLRTSSSSVVRPARTFSHPERASGRMPAARASSVSSRELARATMRSCAGLGK